MTYLNTSAFTLYLIPFCLRGLWKAKIEPSEDLSRYFVTSRLTFVGSPQCALVRSAEEHQPLVVSEATGEADMHPRSSNAPLLPLDHHESPLDVYQTAELACLLSSVVCSELVRECFIRLYNCCKYNNFGQHQRCVHSISMLEFRFYKFHNGQVSLRLVLEGFFVLKS